MALSLLAFEPVSPEIFKTPQAFKRAKPMKPETRNLETGEALEWISDTEIQRKLVNLEWLKRFEPSIGTC